MNEISRVKSFSLGVNLDELDSLKIVASVEETDIILADDEVANRMVAAGNLALVGVDEENERIREAEDGDDALVALEEMQEVEGPLIMMLDLHMPPGMGGEEVAKKVRDQWDDLARKPYLVCCSAEVIEDIKKKPWADRFHYFAEKPLLTDSAQAMLDSCKEWYEAGCNFAPDFYDAGTLTWKHRVKAKDRYYGLYAQQLKRSCVDKTTQAVRPPWYPPSPTGAKTRPLVLNNSLTQSKDVFTPIDGRNVSIYVCGPTVYNSSHMGHARTYLSFDIIRRILGDYFNYNVFFQMNVTDIDDKIILSARKNELFRLFKEEKKSFKEVQTLVEAAMHKHREGLEVKLSAQRAQDRSQLGGRERDELEDLIKQNEMKLGQCADSEENLKRAVASGDVEQLYEAGKDLICQWLDQEKGDQVNDKAIFEAHARHFEREFLEDIEALGVREPDLLTRVTEYVPQVVEFIQKIQAEGFAYESNGSVYFDTQAFRTHPDHSYPKLVPSAGGGATEAEMAEGEGSLGVAMGAEKRNKNDFALWKAGKRGEPLWESPWGQGRPGWHIECSVMASDILGSNFDIHGGGSDLKFPHHDNEMAQAEACHGCPQWVNFFMHTGHLHIKGLKMSKSLKNFITIRQALDNHSAQQMRLMFLMQHWDKPMNFSDQTIEAAKGLETRLKSFFGRIQSVLREEPPAEKPQLWTALDRQLSKEIDAVQESVHCALCDNLDTPSAMKALDDGLVGKINSYLQESKSPKALLLRKGALFLQKMLRIFGVHPSADEIGLSSSSQEKGSGMVKAVDAFSKFRDQVREIAQKEKNKELLEMCDKLRDETFVNLGVRLSDVPEGPAQWALEDPAALVKEMEKAREEKEQQRAEKELKKIENKLVQLKKEFARWEKALVPPHSFFKTEEMKKKYGEWDAEGMPLRTLEGEELSNKNKKQIKKDFEKHMKDHSELQGKGGEAFVLQMKEELEGLQRKLK